MIKEMLTGAAVVFFAVGAYQLTSAFQWPTPNKNWRQAEGWLTGAGSEHSLGVPGKAGAVLEFFGKSKPLMQVQHVSFVYFVNGSLYFKRLELPLNLSPFFEAMKQGNKQAKPSSMSAFEGEDTEMSLAQFNEETKKLEVCTDPGTKMEVVVGRHLSTTYTEQKWEEVPRSNWDRYMPKVLVKYNPANLNQSITEPDLLDGASNLLWSGICFIGLSALLGAGVVYDNLATKPEPEPTPTPFQRRR